MQHTGYAYEVGPGNANPVARPAVRNLGNYHGTGGIVPFVNWTFECGVCPF